MTDAAKAKSVFHEIEAQNPAVARAFRTFRARSQPAEAPQAEPSTRRRQLPGMGPEMWYGAVRRYHRRILSEDLFDRAFSVRRRSHRVVFVAAGLVAAGLIAIGIVVGPAALRFVIQNWKSIVLPAAGLCLGAGVVLFISRVGDSSPLREIDPPDEGAEDPLQELKDLAERTASRLRTAYHTQLWSIFAVGAMFIVLIVWSMIMVSRERLLYASAFGSGGVAMAILTQWKWQPFDRVNQARRQADNADALATGLLLRIKAVSEITDPAQRAKAQWDAVSEYLEHS